MHRGGFADTVLEQHGHSRRTVLTVPNFMFVLAIAGESDMLVAIPRRFAAMFAPRFGLTTVDAPFPLPRFKLSAVAPRRPNPVILLDFTLLHLT